MSKIVCRVTFFLIVGFTSFVVNAKTIFYCETENGKQVEVQTIDEYVHYRFGEKLYEPELELTVAKSEVLTSQWSGVGATEYYDVDLPSNNTIYTVFTALEKRPEGKLEAGIRVQIKDQVIINIYCRNGSLYEDLVGVDFPEK